MEISPPSTCDSWRVTLPTMRNVGIVVFSASVPRPLSTLRVFILNGEDSVVNEVSRKTGLSETYAAKNEFA